MLKITLKLTLLLFFFIIIFFNSHGQQAVDSIFTASEVMLVNVKEVTEESVKFSYPGEEVQNTLSTNTISKIVFRTGRTQVFAEENSFGKVKSGLDWEYVTVIQSEGELKGLYQLDQVNSKAKAATGWGSVGKMENRAKRKLLVETAMNGGNVVYLTQQNSNTRSQNSTSSSVMGGVAYGSSIPNYQSIQSSIEENNEFRFVEKHTLGVNDNDMKVTTQDGQLVKLSEATKNGHLVYVTSSIPGISETKFRISYFDQEQIVLVFRTKKQIVNLILMH